MPHLSTVPIAQEHNCKNKESSDESKVIKIFSSKFVNLIFCSFLNSILLQHHTTAIFYPSVHDHRTHKLCFLWVYTFWLDPPHPFCLLQAFNWYTARACAIWWYTLRPLKSGQQCNLCSKDRILILCNYIHNQRQKVMTLSL